MEDVVKFETGIGRGVLGFILGKFLEGKFGVKFENFTVHQFDICMPADERNLKFSIAVEGVTNKAEVIKLIKGEKK